MVGHEYGADFPLLPPMTDPNGASLSYPIHIDRGLLLSLSQLVSDAAPAHRYGIIIDDNVLARHGDKLRTTFPADRTRMFCVPPGEREKSRERWAQLTDALLEWGAGRDTTVVAVGGGVVCDLGGFVAATFMRGVPVVQVPTTLLAMVDASVGGKTGVDTAAGKNLVGAFHNPSAVVIDPDVLTTLPAPVFRSGLAEMIKHGVLASRKYFDSLDVELPNLAGENGARTEALTQLIADSVRIKASVVSRDEREGGLRQVLNFGHTIAHAIELQFDYSMLHGDAVAIGMVVEAEIAERAGMADVGTVAAIRAAAKRALLPISVPASVDLESVIAATHGDKKSRGGFARYALPLRIGEMATGDGAWSVAVDDDLVRQALVAHSV